MPRGKGDCYGSHRKRKQACWGRSDKASREQMRQNNRRKDRERRKRDNDLFEKKALFQDHPQICPVCLDNVKTHLVSDCGNDQPPWHRYHGFCQECAQDVVANGHCPLCRGAVQNAWHVGVAFFVGH